MTTVMPAGLEGVTKTEGKKRGPQPEREQATSITVSRIDNGFSQA